MKLYPLENDTTQNALAELHRVAGELLRKESTVDLRLVGDFLFLNDVRLRLDLSSYAALTLIGNAMSRHGVGAIEIGADVGRDEWPAFLGILAGEPAAEDPFTRFVQRLDASPCRTIRVEPVQETGAGAEGGGEAKAGAKRAYCQSVRVAREIMGDVRLGRAVNVRRVKRAVQSLVDQVLTNETSIVAMTTLRDYDEYTFTHCVNVCIFSLTLGQKLGFDKLQLYELGLAALFHDVGKMRIDADIVQKPAKLDADEWARIQQHPTEGMLELFSMHGFGEVPYRAMLVAYEHHMKTDLSGYPASRRPREMGLFSRIVAVADAFDAGTSRRSYQEMPWRPEEVFREMRMNPERGFDPLIVKAFMNVTGIFPVGTLVILDTHELAVVVAPNPDPERMHQPIVQIISDAWGVPLTDVMTADLSDTDPASGRPVRSVIKTTDPERYGIRVADYIT